MNAQLRKLEALLARVQRNRRPLGGGQLRANPPEPLAAGAAQPEAAAAAAPARPRLSSPTPLELAVEGELELEPLEPMQEGEELPELLPVGSSPPPADDRSQRSPAEAQRPAVGAKAPSAAPPSAARQPAMQPIAARSTNGSVAPAAPVVEPSIASSARGEAVRPVSMQPPSRPIAEVTAGAPLSGAATFAELLDRTLALRPR